MRYCDILLMDHVSAQNVKGQDLCYNVSVTGEWIIQRHFL